MSLRPHAVATATATAQASRLNAILSVRAPPLRRTSIGDVVSSGDTPVFTILKQKVKALIAVYSARKAAMYLRRAAGTCQLYKNCNKYDEYGGEFRWFTAMITAVDRLGGASLTGPTYVNNMDLEPNGKLLQLIIKNKFDTSPTGFRYPDDEIFFPTAKLVFTKTASNKFDEWLTTPKARNGAIIKIMDLAQPHPQSGEEDEWEDWDEWDDEFDDV